MITAAPQYFSWDAKHSVMVPMRKALAERTYVDAETYRLGVIEERSDNSHKQYFASVNEAWKNLPELWAEQFATADHLRKYALIKCGFYNERMMVCRSKTEALRTVAFIRPMDEYALVLSKGPVVTVYTAKSQSYRAMGKADFQRSKDAVLGYLASLIGTTPHALSTERAA